jgi:AcrR family transcriptional regulator
LIDSWLGLIGEGTNFAAVSLREVARAAGVVPTSFYRHFDDLDELGLAVIDALGRDIGSHFPEPEGKAVTTARLTEGVEAYVRFITARADRIRFMDQARTGGSAALQASIGREVDAITEAVAALIHDAEPGARPTDAHEAAATVVAILLESLSAVVALGPRDRSARQALIGSLTRRIALVLRGVEASARPATRPRKPATRATSGARSAKATKASKATRKGSAA